MKLINLKMLSNTFQHVQQPENFLYSIVNHYRKMKLPIKEKTVVMFEPVAELYRAFM